MTGRRAVIVLHGLGCTVRRMRKISELLAAQGWDSTNLGYASLSEPFETHVDMAHRAADVLAARGADHISIVGHSLGGLIGRAAMARGWGDGRLVLLGSPNRGASIADFLSGFGLYRWFFGACGQTVRPAAVADLPMPSCQTLVIAGGNGGRGYNPLLNGDNDGLVTVEETRISGAAFRRLPVLHGLLPVNPAAIAATAQFLDGSLPSAPET